MIAEIRITPIAEYVIVPIILIRVTRIAMASPRLPPNFLETLLINDS